MLDDERMPSMPRLPQGMNVGRRAIALAVSLVLVGCAGYPPRGMRPGTTESDVRRQMGSPALELAQPGGGRELIYPHGPLGESTYIAHIGADGLLRSIEQVLDDDHFHAVEVGMNRDEVRQRIGPPGEILRLASGKTTWLYQYTDTWGYAAEFSVDFDRGGMVVNKASVRLPYGSDRR